jgi:hypothetical protein
MRLQLSKCLIMSALILGLTQSATSWVGIQENIKAYEAVTQQLSSLNQLDQLYSEKLPGDGEPTQKVIQELVKATFEARSESFNSEIRANFSQKLEALSVVMSVVPLDRIEFEGARFLFLRQKELLTWPVSQLLGKHAALIALIQKDLDAQMSEQTKQKLERLRFYDENRGLGLIPVPEFYKMISAREIDLFAATPIDGSPVPHRFLLKHEAPAGESMTAEQMQVFEASLSDVVSQAYQSCVDKEKNRSWYTPDLWVISAVEEVKLSRSWFNFWRDSSYNVKLVVQAGCDLTSLSGISSTKRGWDTVILVNRDGSIDSSSALKLKKRFKKIAEHCSTFYDIA